MKIICDILISYITIIKFIWETLTGLKWFIVKHKLMARTLNMNLSYSLKFYHEANRKTSYISKVLLPGFYWWLYSLVQKRLNPWANDRSLINISLENSNSENFDYVWCTVSIKFNTEIFGKDSSSGEFYLVSYNIKNCNLRKI